MRREWELGDLIASWMLVEPDWDLVANKTGAIRLGFSVLLKFFEIDGRFPEYAAEVPDAAVAYVAEQVQVEPALFSRYDFSSRTAKYHRSQIREELGFRECTKAEAGRVVVAGAVSNGVPSRAAAGCGDRAMSGGGAGTTDVWADLPVG